MSGRYSAFEDGPPALDLPLTPSASVVGTSVHALSLQEAVRLVGHWACTGRRASVCFTNVHGLMLARREPDMAEALSAADLCLPDGAPVAWMLGRLLQRQQSRVSGPDFMRAYLHEAARRAEPVFLYGSTPDVQAALRHRLVHDYPGLVIAGTCSPPFRTLTESEDEQVVRQINESGARTLWVSLGCPKQEKWMQQHRGRIRPVMLGVGAAFDFHAGTLSRAPHWLQRTGLEWLHRLLQEPRRLWRRYLFMNTAFVGAAIRQLLRSGRA